MATTISLTDDLRAEYDRLYAEADMTEHGQPIVAAACQKILAHWPRYETVAATIGCPPHLIAAIHSLESGCNFSTHLHNGDPLKARTVHVPAGRPVSGDPPFTWEASAMDALRCQGIDKWTDWSIAGLCYVLERYNGWGYRKYHPNVKSPYLWACTSIYTAGKYTSDGKWSETAVSQQAGAMALLIELARQGHPYPAEGVNDAPSVANVAPALSQPAAPGMPPYSLLPMGDSKTVVKAVGTSLPGAGAVTIGGVTISKKLAVAILGLLAVLLNRPLGLGLSDADTADLVKLLSSYLVGQSAVDAFRPLLLSLLKTGGRP